MYESQFYNYIKSPKKKNSQQDFVLVLWIYFQNV